MPNTAAEELPPLDVVAAILWQADGRLLLSQRPAHKHQGGRWEFPGGKVEAGESHHQALARELQEELGIVITDSEPFMCIEHRYPELRVRLWFRTVRSFVGVAHGREGQPLGAYQLDELAQLSFPAANRPVVRALMLPDRLLVLPSPLPSVAQLDATLAAYPGSWVYLRGLHDAAALLPWVARCHAAGARVLVADDAALMAAVGANGLHLRAAAAARLDQRPPVPWLSVACHDAAQLDQAQALGADMALLSPLRATPTHPQQPGMGWEQFQVLAQGRPLSIYALGGVTPEDLPQARQAGARGVAGIRGFWQ